MVAFQAKKLSREDIGARLCMARRARGYSLRRAASRAGIGEKTAVALEAGAYDAIHGAIYLRGFITRYADAVGANPKPLLAALPRGEQRKLAVPVRERRSWLIPACLRWAGAGALVLAVLGYVGFEWQHLVSAPALALMHPQDGIVVQESSLEVQGTSDRDARLEINGETVSGGSDGTFTATVNLHEGANTITVSASYKHGRRRTETRQVMFVPQVGSRMSEIGILN